MPKVRFLTSVSCVDGSFAGGEVANLSAVLAEQWRACGYVEVIAAPEPPAPAAEEPAFVETAAVQPAAEAAAITPKPARKRR